MKIPVRGVIPPFPVRKVLYGDLEIPTPVGISLLDACTVMVRMYPELIDGEVEELPNGDLRFTL